MSRESKTDDIITGWPSLHHTGKRQIIDSALHPCVAEQVGTDLSIVRTEGCELLRDSLSGVLAALSDNAIDIIHTKYLEVKV